MQRYQSSNCLRVWRRYKRYGLQYVGINRKCPNFAPMKIEKNKVVGVHYTLTVEGEKVDQSGEDALVYLHGHGMMIKGFERQLEGLVQGDTYDFAVSPEEGYGTYNNEAIVDLDKSMFLVDGTMSTQVFEGAQLRMTSEEGHPMIGTVVEVADAHVKMDFNHMLAGKTLNFTGHIESLREATEEEISHGHVHGPGGHHH